MANPARLAAAACWAGATQCRLRRMEREAFGQDGIVTSFEPCDQTRWQWPAALPREIGGMTGAAQHSLHLACPVFLLDLDQRLDHANGGHCIRRAICPSEYNRVSSGHAPQCR